MLKKESCDKNKISTQYNILLCTTIHWHFFDPFSINSCCSSWCEFWAQKIEGIFENKCVTEIKLEDRANEHEDDEDIDLQIAELEEPKKKDAEVGKYRSCDELEQP
jgi:hypothetical protein